MKVLKIAVIVVAAAAVVLTAGAALAGAGAFSFTAATGAIASTLGISAGLASTIAIASIGFAALSVIGGLAPKVTAGGQQTKWKADPFAGIPYAMGRTLVGGNIVFKRGHGINNRWLSAVTVLGLGPIHSIEATFMDKSAVTFSGSNAVGTFHNQIYQNTQLGALPEASALAAPIAPIGTPAGWTTSHKLSGLAAVFNTWVYDAKSKTGLTSLPVPSWIINGCLVYDPRLDSTYPGGSGSCRAGNESTYVFSENPHLHALTWAIGRFQNGVRVAGIGAPVAAIDVASFVEGANLDDARGWKVGGVVYTRPDTLWNSLKAMLQAGGAVPVLVGGRIVCVNRAPRVSLATITNADIVGPCSFSGTQPRRGRINQVIFNYRSEAHDWEMVPASPVVVSSYVTLDGDERTRELTFPLVQDATQGAQLATYEICDAREAGPGTVPLKPKWLNYRIGDCVTFAPEDGLSIKAIVTGRSLDPGTGIVTYTLRGETDGKHAFALGQTGTAPPIASLTYSNAVAAPTSDWSLAGTTISANGATIPALVLTGACTNPNASEIVVEYRLYTTGLGDDDNWIGASVEGPLLSRKEITSVTSGTAYQVSVRYRVRGTLGDRAIFGPATVGSYLIATAARLLRSQSVVFPLSAAATPSISVTAFSGVTELGEAFSFPADTITAVANDTSYGVFWNPATPGYEVEVSPAATRMANPALVFVGWQMTPSAGGTYGSGATRPPGSGGGGGNPLP